MTRKDILSLFTPSITLVALVCLPILIGDSMQRYDDPQQDMLKQQKFDTFSSNVRNGKIRLTPDQMLTFMRRTLEDEQYGWQACARFGRVFRDVGLVALAGLFGQVVLIRHLRKRLKP
jgi:hypothetical protein